MPQGDMEKGEFLAGLENAIQGAAQRMEQAQALNNMVLFQGAAEAWRQAQILWLQAAQNMTPDKANAVLIGFAAGGGELDKWLTERRPGPPPSVLTLYEM